jgi:hypothetical protein
VVAIGVPEPLEEHLVPDGVLVLHGHLSQEDGLVLPPLLLEGGGEPFERIC